MTSIHKNNEENGLNQAALQGGEPDQRSHVTKLRQAAALQGVTTAIRLPK